MVKEKDPVQERRDALAKLDEEIASVRGARLERQADDTQTIEIATLDAEISRKKAALAEEKAISARSTSGGSVQAAQAAMEQADQEARAQADAAAASPDTKGS